MSIMTLPCNVLLDIFDFYRNDHDHSYSTVWRWHILVHVCQRWRQIIFESPLRLNLKVLCTYGTSVKKCFDIWPNVPIAINYCSTHSSVSFRPDDHENVICALGRPDRVAHLRLALTSLHLRKFATVIQKPFPALRRLILRPIAEFELLLPAEFLGGSAPRLQTIDIVGIAFPTLPTLLLSARDLVELKLSQVPQTGYISPEVMVACLAGLPKLKNLYIQFESNTLHPLSFIARTILPALTHFHFKGSSKYLEDFTARIICPQLNSVNVDYSDLLADLRVVQLFKFFDLSLGPKIFRHAKACFEMWGLSFDLYCVMVCTGWHSRPATTVITCWRLIGDLSRCPAHFLSCFQIWSILSSWTTQDIH
jgi:hypothetical protein